MSFLVWSPKVLGLQLCATIPSTNGSIFLLICIFFSLKRGRDYSWLALKDNFTSLQTNKEVGSRGCDSRGAPTHLVVLICVLHCANPVGTQGSTNLESSTEAQLHQPSFFL